MSDTLEVIANRIALLAMRDLPGFGRVGPGPVLAVIRDAASKKIYVGLNTDLPTSLADVLDKSIKAQSKRIGDGEVIVMHTDPKAVGGHAEVNALNAAVKEKEKTLGRKLKETDLGMFELHNVWLSGDRKLTEAPRCEHCARITRGVRVTQSMFITEGGKIGEVMAPQRGSMQPRGSRVSLGVTTTSGEIEVPARGSVTRAGTRGPKLANSASGSIGMEQEGGGGHGGTVVAALADVAWMIAEPYIKAWFFKTFIKEKWDAQEREMLAQAIATRTPFYNVLIASHGPEIQKEKAAGRNVKLRVDVDSVAVNTEFGYAVTNAWVSYYQLVFEGSTEMEWPLFQNGSVGVSVLTHGTPPVFHRDTFYIPI